MRGAVGRGEQDIISDFKMWEEIGGRIRGGRIRGGRCALAGSDLN